jgi:hypothetical protein
MEKLEALPISGMAGVVFCVLAIGSTVCKCYHTVVIRLLSVLLLRVDLHSIGMT